MYVLHLSKSSLPHRQSRSGAPAAPCGECHNKAGCVYIFENFQETQKLQQNDDKFGQSVDIHDGLLVIGATNSGMFTLSEISITSAAIIGGIFIEVVASSEIAIVSDCSDSKGF